MPSRTRPQRETATQTATRIAACNALSAVSVAAHHAAVAVLMGAPSSQLRELLDRIRASLDAAGQLPGIAPEAGAIITAEDDVHVDWHMTPDEWAELREALRCSEECSPYIRRLRAAGKLDDPR